MNRREFLKFIAGGAAFLFADKFCLPAEAKKNDDYYHIVLISDLHLPWRDKKFSKKEGKQIFAQKEKLLKNIAAWKDLKEAALLGDFPARYGNEKEFQSVDKFLADMPVKSYLVIGNHDYAYRDKKGKKLEQGTKEEKLAKLNAFKNRYNMPSLYYARSVGKYRLLYLAPDALGKNLLELSSLQLEWLNAEIAAHQDAPMIFFFHAPLKGTLKNYHKSINTPKSTAQPADALEKILKNAPPGSLWVSGHTHTPVSNESFANDSINRFNENIVNIHNPTIDSKRLYTNSLFLYDDYIEVRAFNHLKNVWDKRFDRIYMGLCPIPHKGAAP